MERYRMKSRRHNRGFTLIASLMMLLLLSGLAIGLMLMVNTEGKVGGTDLQNNAAFASAEGGVEKMTSDLAATFQNALSPTASQICALGNTSMQPSLPAVTWSSYQVTPGQLGAACPSTMITNWGTITSGSNQGLWAQIIPVNMLATAAMPGGQEVSMVRNAQVALIPVFQFGAFSESDLSFFSGPDFTVSGPIHTNGDLYPFVGPGSNLSFHNQVSAYGNVVRTQLANGWNPATNYNGTVWMPTTQGGCTTLNALGNCVAMDSPGSGTFSTTYGDGSTQTVGGPAPPATYNTSVWGTFSRTTTNHMLVNGNYGSTVYQGTGGTRLSMPFVGGGALPFQIIRRPPTGESATSPLGQSREYNLAQIHVLISDSPAELPGGAADTNNIRLANVTTAQAAASGTTASYPFGVHMSSTALPAGYPAPPSGTQWNLYFASASNGVPVPSTCSVATDVCTQADWLYAPHAPAAAYVTLYPSTPSPGAPIIPGENNGTPTISICPPASPTPATVPPGCPTTGAYPYYAPPIANGATLYNSPNSTSWNLIDGWLRVEYKDSSGAWHPVTAEWIDLGFARGVTAPTQSGAGTPAGGSPNPINPNAILILQAPADRLTTSVLAAEPGAASSIGTAPVCTNTSGSGATLRCTRWSGAPPLVAADSATLGAAGEWQFAATPTSSPTAQSLTQFNWYPINFYDAREGEVRESGDPGSNDSCTTNGVMNAVEIDVGNLKQWLLGNIGSSGTSVDYTAQNGYVLYFSDRRGMLPDPHPVSPNVAGDKNGDSGLEDVINLSNGMVGTPDGVLESPGGSASPEDVNQNGFLENFGPQNMGLGLYGTVGNPAQNLNTLITSTTPADPYGSTNANNRIATCTNTARQNWISGARHVLKLVDGSLGNVPNSPVGTSTDPGGFTVAAENPVYVQGDYNTNSADTTWNSPTPIDEAGRSSAAVIADTVTLLSDAWDDRNSFMNDPTQPNDRSATVTRYRLAIAAGKTRNFTRPTSWATAAAQDFGLDGGLHNFLRYLENWGGQTLYYKGSIVSLYYSTYNTGTYKSALVYSPPTRGYSFDSDFSTPQGLPPGTPLFRDVNSLGYRQLFTVRPN
jgi:Tfp pilus assembly protein PilX